MKSICAWCGIHLRDNPGDGDISHGICPECRDKELKKLEDKNVRNLQEEHTSEGKGNPGHD
jgi:hypothetical protein